MFSSTFSSIYKNDRLNVYREKCKLEGLQLLISLTSLPNEWIGTHKKKLINNMP